ncbi:MAG: glycoside hydrolase family 3 protein [Bacilli bacterium]|nr:glycoside hydrolase family 3 protein [Bacilli bacterium]
MIKNMTLDQKIGQMLIVYYNSDTYDSVLGSVIKNINPGGFILFANNIANDNQLKGFINGMQEDSNIPMFITIDQEGGLVQRLKPIEDIKVQTIPAMATIIDDASAFEIGKAIGKDLSTYGINMNYAPVLDINMNEENTVISSRSFSNNPHIVSDLGLAVARGLKEYNIMPVFKHFPGHGSTVTDPHYDLPVLNKTKQELYQHELIPFINAINNNADVIMIGHIAVPELTGDDTPASLSKEVITNLLKGELGFKGLVITDALNMGALTNNYSSDEIIIKAINAGTDILLMPGSSKKTIEKIKIALAKKQISEVQIEESVRKILKLKFKMDMLN